MHSAGECLEHDQKSQTQGINANLCWSVFVCRSKDCCTDILSLRCELRLSTYDLALVTAPCISFSMYFGRTDKIAASSDLSVDLL